MSEIIKLYENAGILKECLSPCYINKTWRKTHDCPNCDNRENYPPFTAEKQLELIKWLGKSKNGFGFFNDGTEGLSCHCDFNWEWFRKDFYAEDFDSALVGLINSLWQDLTEEEKQQVRGILE